MNTLQLMLMPCEGRKIWLLPAWPREWNGQFKRHAPKRTTVEGQVMDGKVIGLKVAPESRAKDVEIRPMTSGEGEADGHGRPLPSRLLVLPNSPGYAPHRKRLE